MVHGSRLGLDQADLGTEAVTVAFTDRCMRRPAIVDNVGLRVYDLAGAEPPNALRGVDLTMARGEVVDVDADRIRQREC